MEIKKLICHRKPERTLNYKGHYFPVCARCTGFYISLTIYFIYTYFFYVNYNIFLLIIALILLIPAAVDGLTQLTEKRESNNFLRLITGFLGGFGLGIIIKAMKYKIFMILGGL